MWPEVLEIYEPPELAGGGTAKAYLTVSAMLVEWVMAVTPLLDCPLMSRV